MKQMMLIGGLLGFLIGLSFGLAQSSEWPSVLWRASVAAYVAGLLLRWWGRIWIRSLQQAHQQRLTAAPAPAPSTSSKTKL